MFSLNWLNGGLQKVATLLQSDWTK